MFNAERWDENINPDVAETSTAKYRMCIGAAAVDPADVIDPIDVLHLGTASLSNVVVSWRLKPNGGACTGAGTYLLDSRTITTLNSGIPFSALPDSNLVVPAGVTAGDWGFCAKIDPGGLVAETDENDNVVANSLDQPMLILDDPNDPLCP
jgi:hypothetical protein